MANKITLIIIIGIFLAACNAGDPAQQSTVSSSITSISTNIFTPTQLATITPTQLPTFTPQPSATLPPTATRTNRPTHTPINPLEINPRIGDSLRQWGTPGYTIVWSGTATYPAGCNESPDPPMDYYCANDPTRSNHYWGHWGNNSLHTVGYITDDGTTTLLFDQPARDIVIVWGRETYVDSIQAILEDGTLIPMGYTPDTNGTIEYNGTQYSPIVPFYESDGSWIATNDSHGWSGHNFNIYAYNPQPCGFMGLGPDNNVIRIPNNTESSSGLLTLFPRYPADNLENGVYQRGLYAYQIVGVSITQFTRLPTGAEVCE